MNYSLMLSLFIGSPILAVQIGNALGVDIEKFDHSLEVVQWIRE